MGVSKAFGVCSWSREWTDFHWQLINWLMNWFLHASSLDEPETAKEKKKHGTRCWKLVKSSRVHHDSLLKKVKLILLQINVSLWKSVGTLMPTWRLRHGAWHVALDGSQSMDSCRRRQDDAVPIWPDGCIITLTSFLEPKCWQSTDTGV